MNQDKNLVRDLCPLQSMIRSAPAAEEKGLSIIVRAKRMLHRHLSVRTQKRLKDAVGLILDWVDRRRGKANPQKLAPVMAAGQHFSAGDMVRVKSREEIQATLDRWRSLKGCGFLEEMARYCGSTQRVLKRVERFIDERDYRLKKASGIVLLDGVMCSGTGRTGRCDRACFFFWREEWLEKLDAV